MFLLLGGHWMLLQSVAWSRMLMDFSRQDSLAQAVSKTFDGRHPCSLCRQIVQGRQQEQDEQRRRPLLASDKLPELLSAGTTATAPLPSADPVRMLVQVAALKPQTSLPPPKPPPRGSC